MKPYHKVRDVSLSGQKLTLEIDGQSYTFSLADISTSLASATDEQISVFEVSPSGYGIHWPLIDEDVSIDGLLGIRHSPGASRESA